MFCDWHLKKEKKGKEMMLSAHQVTQGLKHDDLTFVIALLEMKDDLLCEIPIVV